MKQTLYVTLLAHTPAPEAVAAMGARLCYSGKTVDELARSVREADQQAFLQKLADMRHLSPVEHAAFTFGVEGVSRALLAQLTRHRLASFSVQSQRYVNQTDGDEFGYVEPPSIAALGEEARARYREQMQTMARWYAGWNELLGADKREDARFVLPNAAATRLVMTANARELAHVFEERCCRRAQWEIRALAYAMLGHVLAVAPQLFAACGPACARGACTQGAMGCGQAGAVRLALQHLKAFVDENKQDPAFSRKLCAWATKENSYA